MDNFLDHSTLNEHCRADLRRLLKMFEANSRAVSKGVATTTNSGSLPNCVDQLTASKAAITKPPLFRPSTAAQKQVPSEWLKDPALEKGERKLFQSVNEKLQRAASAPKKDRKLPPMPLSAKEQDFIYRYAEYKHGTKVLRGEESHKKSLAYRAYTEAFLSFMGRPPSTTELQEADRLNFVENNGRVCVVSYPHASIPHQHISNHNSTVAACDEQVHEPHRPYARAARPGSTLLDRQKFSPPRDRESAPPKPHSTSVSPQRSVPRATTAQTSKRYCSLCGARLPPRLVKTVCPTCDA